MSGDPPGTREPSQPAAPDPTYAFVAGALDRADALRDDPDALDALWARAGVVEVDPDGRVRAPHVGPHWPRGDALAPVRAPEAVFLGLDRDGRGWFARTRAPPEAAGGETAGDAAIDLRTAAAGWPAFDATLFAQARAVLHWQARHRHCGACGARLSFVRGGWLGQCEGCGLEHYPRTDAAVIVAVDDGERLLLGRQRGWAPGRWSVIAGFVEPGESLEQTVAREVHEETAVRVHDCRYIASQPWPFPSALMLGFVARAEPQVPVAGEELEAVRWFDADAVRAGLARDWNAPPGSAAQPHAGAGAGAGQSTAEAAIVLSPRLSIARWLIESWLAAHDSRSDTRNP